MKVDIEFTIEAIHKDTGRKHKFSVKASDIRHAVNTLFHPEGFTLDGVKEVKLRRENYHVLKVVQREG